MNNDDAKAAGAPDLRSLIERLEAATKGSRDLDADIWLEMARPDPMVLKAYAKISASRYTTSLDAALTLVPTGWKIYDCEEHEIDWWSWCLDDRENPRKREQGHGRSMVLALCIAALKARLADQGGPTGSPKGVAPGISEGGEK